MSRSLVRWIAAAALVATPAISQAQTCTVPQAGGNCNVAFNGTLTVPVLASLDVAAAGSLALTTPDWNAFFAAPAATTTVSNTSFTVKSNSAYSVGISATAWNVPAVAGAARALSTIRWAVDPTTCPAAASITGDISSGTLVAAGTPTGGATNLLCLALDFPADLSDGALRPGAYSLPITVTITAP